LVTYHITVIDWAAFAYLLFH